MSLRVIVAALPALGLVASALPAAPSSLTAVEVARRVEKRHAALHSFSAAFVQTYHSGTLGRSIQESGTVAIRRPGRMRWEYRKPEHKLFVCDGVSAYFFVPEDRQVTVKPIEGSEGLAFRLLLGELNLLDEFSAKLAPSPPGFTPRLVLTPRKPSAELDEVTLDIDAQFRIVGIEILDPEGNRSQFVFTNLRENPDLPDKLFHFSIPKGVEVIQG